MQRSSLSLPLKPAVVLILTALAERPLHGTGLHRRTLELSEGSVDLGTSHLYRHLRQLLVANLIDETQTPPDEDQRLRTYALTQAGRQVLAAELGRLESLVERGRRLGLVLTGESP